MASIMKSTTKNLAILHKTLTQTNSIWLKLIHSHSTWWCQPSWICHLRISHFEQKKTSLIHSDSTWWWQQSWILPSWIQPFCTRKNSLINCHPTWWWQPSWTLPCWIQPLPSWIQTPCYLLSRFTQKHSHSTLTLTQTNSILIQTHSFSLNLMMATILNSAMLNFAILDSAFLVFPLKLTHTCHDWVPIICTKKASLIHSDSTWWWQPSWILPCWIQPLPSWIETPCYLLSESLKNTLTPLWLWLKLIQSD